MGQDERKLTPSRSPNFSSSITSVEVNNEPWLITIFGVVQVWFLIYITAITCKSLRFAGPVCLSRLTHITSCAPGKDPPARSFKNNQWAFRSHLCLMNWWQWDERFIFMKTSQVVTLMRGPAEGNPVMNMDWAYEGVGNIWYPKHESSTDSLLYMQLCLQSVCLSFCQESERVGPHQQSPPSILSCNEL